MLKVRWLIVAFLSFISVPGSAASEEFRAAVASNFLMPLRALAPAFEAFSGHKMVIIPGSTGRLYAQIVNGAPFDVFLAADSLRPELLEEKGFALAEHRFTYAIGKLAFWLPDTGRSDGDSCRTALKDENLRRVVIANPITAPYGLAAESTLRHEKLWLKFQSHIVKGENVSQALQYLITRNADAGFVALSQLKDPLLNRTGCVWEVPDSYYPSLKQQVILLKRATNNKAALAFISFLRSPEARDIIARLGYDLPS